jgi:Flp pilus assembly protein TadD
VDAYLLANRPDLAFEAAAPDRANLQRLASGLIQWPGEEQLIVKCSAAADQLLLAESESPDATPETQMERGSYEMSHGRVAQAVTWFQKAVNRDYGRVDWRLSLAQAQAKTGQYEAAVQNVRICLRLRAKMPEAEKLLTECAAAVRAAQVPVTP